MKTSHPLLFVPACLSAILLWTTPTSRGVVIEGGLQPTAAPTTAPTTVPTAAADLLGRRIDEVGRFVVPTQIRGRGFGGQTWVFGADRKLVGFQALDGVIVEVNPEFDLEEHRRADPFEAGPYLGQSLTDLLNAQGQSQKLSWHQARSPIDGKLSDPEPYLVYGGRWHFIADGIVTGITKPIPEPKKSGPGR